MHTFRSGTLRVAVWLTFGAATLTAGPLVYDLQSRTILGFDTTGEHRISESYLTGPGGVGTSWVGSVNLLPANAIYDAGTANLPTNFLDVLSLAFGTGWSYSSAVNPLSDGSLKIHTYDALSSTANGVASGICSPCAGAEIDVQYVPAAGTTDPTTNLHWIQVILNNNSLTPPNVGPGNLENIVDTRSVQKSPYYDDGYAANNRNLFDLPSRYDYQQTTWLADLFLVSGPNLPANGSAVTPGAITIYGGVEYGWTTSVPEPGAFLPVAGALFALCLTRRRAAQKN